MTPFSASPVPSVEPNPSSRAPSMHYEPRTIAFLCELIHPPSPPDPSAIQKIHNGMFESPPPLYQSFAVTPQGATLSNPVSQPGAFSSVAFLQDRMQFREELSEMTIDSFGERVRQIAAAVGEQRQIPIFPAQVVTIRSLINPRNFRDSRVFMRDAMLGFGGQYGEFEREPGLFGFRLVFPPSQENPNAYTLRVESYANDPRSLYIENQGSFGPTLPAQGLEAIESNVHATYDFIVQHASRFIGRFDVRPDA